jgi:hypothetical protein
MSGKQELTYRFSTHELGRGLRYYRASDSKTCALRKLCTRNKNNRTLTREENEQLMEQMAERMMTQPEKFKLRKTLAEHPLETTKRWLHALHVKRAGESPHRMESDHAGL